MRRVAQRVAMSAALMITFVSAAALSLDHPWNGATQTREYSEVVPACAPTGLIISLHGAGGNGAGTCAGLYEVKTD